MNRVIKFRAFGGIGNDKKEMFSPYVDEYNDLNDGLANLQDTEYAIMQYTGLKDKNGKDVFEGDILKNTANEVFTIYFSNGCFFMHPQWNDDDDFDIALYVLSSIPLVIGNIYENSYLLNMSKLTQKLPT